MSPDLFLVVNPGSAGGRSRQVARRYRSLLRDRGVPHAWQRTRSLPDVTAVARGAVRRGYRTIVAVGGDGTINGVINGVVGAGAKTGRVSMGVLYAGTSPDFCRYHGLPTAPEPAVEVLVKANARPVDVCRIHHHDARGLPITSFFGCTTNIGLGAGIAGRSNRLRRTLGDFLGTLLAAVVTIARSRPRTVALVQDDVRIDLARVLNVTVGKNPHLASGLKLDVDIGPADGRMFVFAIQQVSRMGLLAALPRLYSGAAARDARFHLERASTVGIETGRARSTVEFDGDPAGWAPARIDVLPRALSLIGARG